MLNLVFITCVLIVSIVLTYYVKCYTLNNNIVDIPNARSSHTTATPRGGGLAFVVVFISGTLVLRLIGLISIELLLALLGGGITIAGIGWWDDRIGLAAWKRAIVHVLVAVWALYWLGGIQTLNVGIFNFYIGWFGNILAALMIVWMINLYNFMDGIDGLAGAEGVSVALITGIFLLWYQYTGMAMISLILAASVLGFLIWNWPPAKIFMGDVGSGFLGFVFAIIALVSESSGFLPLIALIVLMGVFIVDATMTLVWRIKNKEKWYLPHRTHVYQLAVQAGYTHLQVTISVIGINIILGILMLTMTVYPAWMLFIGLFALSILVVMNILLRKKFTRLLSDKQLT